MPYEKVGKNEPVCIADEVPFEIPESWEWAKIETISMPIGNKNNQIQSKEVLPTGKIPVVSQGKDLIDGYCNDVSKKIDVLPLVMFGDHTRNVKYIDFEFVIGADGTKFHKILSCNSEYTYYWMLYAAETLRNRGYARHYTLLKECFIPLPPLQEQVRIVSKIKAILPLVEKYGCEESKRVSLDSAFPNLLKKSILQEAVQGKLVPQDPADEPASILLERIRAEKEQLIKAGKIKRDKHESVIFRRDNSHYEKRDSEEVCIDEEIPFDIPDSWAWFRLRTVLQQASTGPFGSMLHKNDYTFEGVPIINPADIKDGEISSTKIKKVSYETAQRLSSYMLHFGDVIIGRRGEMGRSAAIDTQQEGWLCGTGCFYVTPLSVLSPNYLVFFLKSPYAKTLLIDNSVGTTMNNLNHSILGNMLIPLPPIAEQIKIISQYEVILSILDA